MRAKVKRLITWGKEVINQVMGKFIVSPRTLDHFGISAYNSIKKSLVELCSNSYDADATRIDIVIPKKVEGNSAIIVQDNGTGMSLDEFQKKYLEIGRNKRIDGDTTSLGRKVIGNKGIGKLAGFGIAGVIRIETWKDGVMTVAKLERKEFAEDISKSKFEISQIKNTGDDIRGTKITLEQLRLDLRIPQEDVLKRYLRNQLPDIPNFRMYVNNQECSTEDILGERVEIDEKIESLNQRITGFYIVTNSKQNKPGFSVRVRGRVVTTAKFFNVDFDSYTNGISKKIVGEIIADFLDGAYEKNNDSVSFINTTRDGFTEDNETVEKFYQWARKFVKETLKKEKDKAINKRSHNIFSNQEIIKRLDSLPAPNKERAKKMIRSALGNLKNVPDDETMSLIDMVLRYFESNVLRELFSSIMQSNPQDIEKLADMIAEWGVREVASVTTIINQQIGIIYKMEELINSSTHEVLIHKLFEKNMWLLDENYQVLTSNKTLNTLLEGMIASRYANKKSLRPDIVCFSEIECGRTVVIEFKRPKETITLDHLKQAIEYRTIITKSNPSIVDIKIFIIGTKFDDMILDNKESQGNAGNFFYSYSEVLHKARLRFKKILNILEGEESSYKGLNISQIKSMATLQVANRGLEETSI